MKPEEVKSRRKALGLTQVQLAVMVGVSLFSIRLWESGGGSPNPENLVKLKNALGVKE